MSCKTDPVGKLGRGVFFPSELDVRSGNPAHIYANLPEDRRDRALEISPSLQAGTLRWGGLSWGRGGVFL